MQTRHIYLRFFNIKLILVPIGRKRNRFPFHLRKERKQMLLLESKFKRKGKIESFHKANHEREISATFLWWKKKFVKKFTLRLLQICLNFYYNKYFLFVPRLQSFYYIKGILINRASESFNNIFFFLCSFLI